MSKSWGPVISGACRKLGDDYATMLPPTVAMWTIWDAFGFPAEQMVIVYAWLGALAIGLRLVATVCDWRSM